MQAGSTPQMEDNFSDLSTPNPADMQLQLEQLVQQGSLSPEQAQTIMLGQSSMNDVSADPQARQAQMEALAQLSDITNSGGLTAIDKAKMNEIFTDEDTKARGAREAIIQNAQARGMGGSGLDIAAQLQNQQESANRANTRGLDVAAQAQQRALDALAQQGQLGTQVAGQTFDQGAAKATAADAIAKFNAQNQQQQVNTNTAARNDAAAKNLAAKQAVADTNTGTRNAQQQYNKQLIQQNYENELKKRGGQTQVASANQQAAGQNSQNQANATNQTIGTGLTVASMFSDERGKENIESFDPGEFLDSLTGYKYDYKDKKHGEGKQVGVMAQDLEKTEAGSKMVVNTPEGKVVEYAKAGPAILASLAELNKKVKKMEEGE